MFKFQKIKSFRSTLLLTLICILGFSFTSHANAGNGIQPMWDNTKTVQTVLSFSDGQALCSTRIVGKSGASRIKGTLTLKDETTGKEVNSWSFDVSKSSYYTIQYEDATPGHTYNLSVSAYVYNSEGTPEHVTGSVTKDN